MRKAEYGDAIMWSAQAGWWVGTIIGAIATSIIIGTGGLIFSLLIGGIGSALMIAVVNDLVETDPNFWRQGKNRTFRMVENQDGLVDVYTKVGLFWVLIQSSFEDSYKAQEYIASRRKQPFKEIGSFKA